MTSFTLAGLMMLEIILLEIDNSNCTGQLAYQSNDSLVNILYENDRVYLPLKDIFLNKASLDSVCEIKKMTEVISFDLFRKENEGSIPYQAYFSFMTNVLFPANINELNMHYSGYDTLNYGGKTYELYKFALSFDDTENSPVYIFIYAKNLFLTLFNDPRITFSGDEYNKEYVYEIACFPKFENDSLITVINKKSNNLLYGSGIPGIRKGSLGK